MVPATHQVASSVIMAIVLSTAPEENSSRKRATMFLFDCSALMGSSSRIGLAASAPLPSGNSISIFVNPGFESLNGTLGERSNGRTGAQVELRTVLGAEQERTAQFPALQRR